MKRREFITLLGGAAAGVKLWNDLRGWITAKAAALRLCLRMTVAGILTYVLAKLFALPEGLWAVITTVLHFAFVIAHWLCLRHYR